MSAEKLLKHKMGYKFQMNLLFHLLLGMVLDQIYGKQLAA